MKVHVKSYGVARDILGRSVEVEIPGTTVGDLRQALIAAYPPLAGLASLLVAINEEYASDETLIQQEDEVVLIPPVSGG